MTFVIDYSFSVTGLTEDDITAKNILQIIIQRKNLNENGTLKVFLFYYIMLYVYEIFFTKNSCIFFPVLCFDHFQTRYFRD